MILNLFTGMASTRAMRSKEWDETITHELITGVPELEIRRRGCQFVDELVDCGGEPRVFVTLQIGF